MADEFGSVRPSATSDLAESFFFFHKVRWLFRRKSDEALFFLKKTRLVRSTQKFQKWSKNVLKFSQKSNLFICTFFTRIWKYFFANFLQKPQVWEIWFLSYMVDLQTNQNAESFKLQDLTNELRYEVEFLYVFRHS